MTGTVQSLVVNVPRTDFYEVIRDYESYPAFLPDMEEVRVLVRDGDTVDVHFTLNLIKRIRYVLRLVERPAEFGLDWTLVEGMFKRNEGGWTLEELPGGKTRASYTIEVSVGVFLPGSLVNKLVGQTLPATLAAFKRRAEALHGTAD